MAKELFSRYIWLVDLIYRSKKITFDDINKRWMRTDMSEGKPLPLRTFHNWIDKVEEVFDINIICNKRGGYYYAIENVEDLEKDGLRNWLLNTFSVNNLIHESYPLKQRILFEDIPSGRAFLTPIIEAMREGRIIRFSYQSYWWNEPKMVEAEPYCVKVFKQRWYVVVRNRMHEALRIYALDRILSLDFTDVTFEYPADFDPQAYFDASFGIIVDEECEIEAVQIKVYNNQSQYLRALPLHHTQKEIAKTDDYSIFEYILRPTYDFKQELLSHGDDIEVLSPAWLREEIKKIAGRMYRRYR